MKGVGLLKIERERGEGEGAATGTKGNRDENAAIATDGITSLDHLASHLARRGSHESRRKCLLSSTLSNNLLCAAVITDHLKKTCKVAVAVLW